MGIVRARSERCGCLGLLRLLDTMQPRDALHAYSSSRDGGPRREARRGYVLLRGGLVVDHFETATGRPDPVPAASDLSCRAAHSPSES